MVGQQPNLAAHITNERFRLAAGFEAQPVTFRGNHRSRGGSSWLLLLADDGGLLASDGRKGGALAVTSRKRSAALPKVPTTIEADYPDFDFWVGMFAPAKTPANIVEKLYAVTRKISESADFRERMAAIGGEPLEPMTRAQFAGYVQAEVARNAAIAKAAGLKPQ